MADPRRVHVWIEGIVQGVFFRARCAEEARRRGVCGWVRNLSDGRVEAVFQGAPAEVEAMLGWCRKGPPSARVDRVEVQEEPPERDLAGFRITG